MKIYLYLSFEIEHVVCSEEQWMLGGRKACSNYFYWHCIIPLNVIIYILGTDYDKDQLDFLCAGFTIISSKVIFLTNHLHGNFHHFIDLRYALDSEGAKPKCHPMSDQAIQ